MSDIISIAQEGARLAERATPGPWWINPIEWADNGFGGKEYSEDGGVMCAERMWPDGLDDNYVATGIRYDENSEFIVHAREHYAALCRAVIDAETARASAFEEAAKVAERFPSPRFARFTNQTDKLHAVEIVCEIAAAIRSKA